MTRILALHRSLLGKKVIVAVTGAMLLAFLLLHVAGNLKAFLPDPSPGIPDIDLYSHWLRSMGEPLLPSSFALWAVRIVLLLALVLHVECVLQLAVRNRRARPVRYDRVEHAEATASARWMLYTGALLLLFVVIHLLHFTTGSLDPDGFVRGAVYANLHHAFGRWPVVLFYLGALVVLTLHLSHGAWSLFQSLGLDNPDRNRALRRTALAIAIAIPLGFAAVPLAFSTGLMKPPQSHVVSSGGAR